MDEAAEDRLLVERAVGGDAAAFAALFERHYDRVYRTAFTIMRREAEAEDLAQDVWTALPRKLPLWRGEARITTWLHSVTLNAGRDALRRLGTRSRAAEGFAEVDELRRGADADRQARLSWLRDALEHLPDDLRETVALVVGDEMSQMQAAQALGVAEGTVAWRMSKVKELLRGMARSGRDDP